MKNKTSKLTKYGHTKGWANRCKGVNSSLMCPECYKQFADAIHGTH